MSFKLKLILLFLFSLALAACATVKPIGQLGPKQLPVYSISQNDFLSASRMLVVLDEKGNIAAYTGGTVNGAGTVGFETAGTFAMAGAMIYGAKAIKHGLENAQVNVKASHVTVSHTIDPDLIGKISDRLKH